MTHSSYTRRPRTGFSDIAPIAVLAIMVMMAAVLTPAVARLFGWHGWIPAALGAATVVVLWMIGTVIDKIRQWRKTMGAQPKERDHDRQ